MARPAGELGRRDLAERTADESERHGRAGARGLGSQLGEPLQPALQPGAGVEEAQQLVEYAFPAPDATPPSTVQRWNTPPWAYRVLRGLSRHGRADRAIAHLKERHAPYLPGHPRNPTPVGLQGPYGGPLPEYWRSRDDLTTAPGEPNPAQPVDVTGSHGWGAVPLLWLHDSLLGVEVVTPGGGRLRIAPTTGGLPYVSGWTQTPRGAVHVHLDPQQGVLRVVLPSRCVAELHQPCELASKAHGVAGQWRIQGPTTWTWPGRADVP